MARHTLARTLHDVGLATWFGGSLMGAVGLNGAAASLLNPAERAAAATVGWSRFAPVNAVAIGAHLIGAVRLLQTERGRVARQTGVARSSAIKTGLTVAALGTTAYSGVLNRKMAAAGQVPVQGATEPAHNTPPEVARTQKQLKAVQWLIPALTGSLVSVTAWQSEQMRPRQVLAGSLPSLPHFRDNRIPVVGAVAASAVLVSALRKRSSLPKDAAAYASVGTRDFSGTTTGTATTTPPTMPAMPATPVTSAPPVTPARSTVDPKGSVLGTSSVGKIDLSEESAKLGSESRSADRN